MEEATTELLTKVGGLYPSPFLISLLKVLFFGPAQGAQSTAEFSGSTLKIHSSMLA